MVEQPPVNYTRRVLDRGITKSKSRRAPCPPGYVRHKGYIRRFGKGILERGYTVKRANGKMYRIKPEKEEVHVKSACVKDKHSPGKIFGHIRKGEFKKHGYSYTESTKVRRDALEKAVTEFGAPSVYYKLKNLVKLSLRSAPEASKVFKEDMYWIHTHHKLKEY